MDIVCRLEDYWAKPGLGRANKAHRASTETDIQDFEKKFAVKLPEDLRVYFLRLNGTDGEGDTQLFRFWSLSELRPVDFPNFKAPEVGQYFLFGDLLVECSYIAINLGTDPHSENQVILPDYPGSPIIASSFTEFIELYLSNDPKLYGNEIQLGSG